jgi:hypothetical protein
MSAFNYPTIGTMPSRTLCLLLQGHAITHLDFWQYAATYRLSAPVYQLRCTGWDVRDSREVVPTSDRTKRSASVARYHLPQDIISAAGEEGRDYVRRVQEWERKRAAGMTGTAATAPADKAAGTNGQGTDQAKGSTGASL